MSCLENGSGCYPAYYEKWGISMDQNRRRELAREYKERPVTGGVYSITNRETGQLLLLSGLDLAGYRNRFEFSVATNSCVYAKLLEDWKKYGGTVFDFTVLEELEQKPEQSAKEFREDIVVLEELWREKLADHTFY